MDSADTNPNANDGESGQANSPDNSQTEAIVALTEKLANVEGQLNSLRSDKDKSVVKTNQRLSDFETKQQELVTMQSYLTKYGSPEEAARAMALDALLQSPVEAETPASDLSQTPPAGEEGSQTGESNLVPLLGVDEKDAAFVALVGTGMSPNDAAVQLATQRNQPQDPNAASGIAPTGAVGGAGEAQQAVLESEYAERLSKVRQGDWKALGALKDDMRKKGYEVW